MSILEISLTANNRPISFNMTFDPTFTADYATRQYLLKNNFCEPDTVHLMARVLRPGDYAIDGGANIGFFSLVMSRLVGDTGKIFAFEPGVNNVFKLKENLKLNNIINVEVIDQPLWIRHEKVTLHLALDSGLNSLRDQQATMCEQEMFATSLYDYCDDTPRLIKLDVEGAEEYVMKGLHPLRHKTPPFIVCEVNPFTLKHFDCTPRSLRMTMSTMGYDTFVLHQDGSMPTMVPPDVEVVRDRLPPNLLFSTLNAVGKVWTEVKLNEDGRVAA